MRVLLVVGEPLMHERMGPMMLAAVLRRAGIAARIAVAARLGIRGMRRLLGTFRPSVIGWSAMTGEHARLVEINRTLKRDFDFVSVFGGPHATFFPDLARDPSIDAVCRGEGESAFLEFCTRVRDGKSHHRTANFIVKRAGRACANPLRPLTRDLDSLPFADREAMYAADPSLRHEPHRMFFAGRGCPFSCTYCFNRRFGELYRGAGKRVRLRTPANLVDEIAVVRSAHGLRLVWIDDDVFPTFDSGWMDEFVKKYPRRVGLPFVCNVRADLVSARTVANLRDAGLRTVIMGVECGDEGAARSILGRRVPNARLKEAARWFKDAGVRVVTQNLVGLPVPDPYGIDLATLDLNAEIGPDYAWSSILYPYPGTAIEAYARRHGRLRGDAFPETNKRASALSFRSRAERRRVENLHKLFDFFVRFPRLRGWRDMLCDLPAERFYTALYYLWYGWKWKTIVFPFRSFPREIGGYLSLWSRMVAKS